jgi:hypothetical protein
MTLGRQESLVTKAARLAPFPPQRHGITEKRKALYLCPSVTPWRWIRGWDPISAHLSRWDLEVDPVGRFPGGNFRVADNPFGGFMHGCFQGKTSTTPSIMRCRAQRKGGIMYSNVE